MWISQLFLKNHDIYEWGHPRDAQVHDDIHGQWRLAGRWNGGN